VVSSLRTQAAEKGIRLSLDVKKDLPPVAADADKIALVAANLINNALRYARSEICVSAEWTGNWVSIYVRDDGRGIPYEQQTRIFEKFVQFGDDSSGGAGLGLALAKEIVRAHHGSIWVESDPGRGSLFIVALPVAAPVSQLTSPGRISRTEKTNLGN
jgi:NtrC-family two-component system sensor histidine kinase KinB